MIFESWGFKDDVLAWLMRRCNRMVNDFTGLISVLFEEGMLPSEIRKPTMSVEIDPDKESALRDDKTVEVRKEHWESSDAFSKTFPVSVAEGELSLRVERLLAEGCRYLSTTHKLGAVFLVFSDHGPRRRIAVFGTTDLDQEEGLFREKVRETIAELGADSAMMLYWVNVLHNETSASDDPTEAVMVVARDPKGYLMGWQPARLIDGEYVFQNPRWQ